MKCRFWAEEKQPSFTLTEIFLFNGGKMLYVCAIGLDFRGEEMEQNITLTEELMMTARIILYKYITGIDFEVRKRNKISL